MTRHDHPGGRAAAPARPLMAGPRWYRTRIRTWGPALGLVPMALFGLVCWVALASGDGRSSGLLGLVAGVSAAPGLLVAGVPFADTSTYPAAIVASAVLWLLLGLISSRRATRRSIASWRDYTRELSWLSVAVVLGAIVALAAAAAILDESLV